MRRKRKRIKKRTILLTFFLIYLSFLAFKNTIINRTEKKLLSPVTTVGNLLGQPIKNPVRDLIEQEMSKAEEGYGIYVENLKTGETFTYNEDAPFQTASLYKLWVMGTVFEQIKNGHLREDEILKARVEDLNEKFKIASESAELTEGEIDTNVKLALERMIIISDNYSALILTSRIGGSSITNFLKENGLNNSKLGSPPQSTPRDIALFYKKLYKGEIVDSAYSKRMMDILKRQSLNDRIPKYLPKEIKVAHKTGELDRAKHDTGIVFGKNGDYLIVVMSENGYPPEKAEKIAKFSKTVFDYFENK